MIINHNISAINANRNLTMNGVAQTRSMGRLASGERINRAADDAAGLAVSERMRTQIRGTNQAVRNANDMISFVQTTEGYLGNTGEAIQRMRELAVQAANGIYSDSDRVNIQAEISQLIQEVNRIAEQSQFNGMQILDGSIDGANGGASLVGHIGANMDQRISVDVRDMSAAALQIEGLVYDSTDAANQAIGTLDGALDMINRQRADLGAFQNRMEMLVNAQMNAAQNLQFSESQIRDQDMAAGAVELTRDNILMQSGIAMLAQANTRTQGVLSLLN